MGGRESPICEAEVRGRCVRPICEAVGVRSHTGRESDPRGYLTDFTAKRIASHGRVRSDFGLPRPHRSASQIGLTDRTLKSVRPWESEVGGRQTDHMTLW